MELFRTNEFYIFLKDECSLWWDRQTGAFIPKAGWDLTYADDPVCLGICDGLIGKVEHQTVFDPRLLIIRDSIPVGKLHGDNEVYKIKSIAFLPLGSDNLELNLTACPKHKSLSMKKSTGNPIFDNIQKNPTLSKTWGTLKSAGNTIKNTTQQAAAIATGTPKRHAFKDKEKFEKQIVEELYKIFTDTNSFYYSKTTDITNSLQRLCQIEKETVINPKALWKIVDDRFFWNKHMMRDLIDSENSLCDPWILPIIQGYIQIEDCKVEVSNDVQSVVNDMAYEVFTLCIISRRSRFRAGTRYKRRGVDEHGHCANYVETEQLVTHQFHEVSFVQVRGSVPVYWSQPGYKYRPPPRIDKGENDTCMAFAKHFENEKQIYGPVCIINLVDQSGKEKVIFDAYSQFILKYNSPDIIYVTFDFHEYCRGMRFENVSILLATLTDIIRDMNYCWRDTQGHICLQNGVFRVNCIDCLDRTNVVQTALGKAVIEIQFCKLGLISPEGNMPETIKSTFQLLWANNGDTISKQYAGTNALKGDYTRTGERKFTGIMKDGMNSANRYYLSRFKDATRQGTIDLMLGEYVNEDTFTETKTHQFEEDTLATAEHVKLLIEDCKKMLINHPEDILGAWGLINADPTTGDPNETEMDSILILTKSSYFVADYDDQVDTITKYQEVSLSDLHLLEFGVPESSSSLFKATKRKFCIRLNYKVNDVAGYYHMFRSTNLRFFNNMTVVIRSSEEEIESLNSICEAFIVAIDVAGLPKILCSQGCSLHRRKSKVVNSSCRSTVHLDIAGLPHMTRNVSESQLLALKTAGTHAISNMTQQFSKLHRIGSNLRAKDKKPNFTIDFNKSETSSDSDEDYDYTQKGIYVATKYQNIPEKNRDSAEDFMMNETRFSDDLITETFLPGVGIVMGSKKENVSLGSEVKLEDKQNLLRREDSSQVDDVQLSSIMDNVSVHTSDAPEIHINLEGVESRQAPATLNLAKRFSRSSGQVDDKKYEDQIGHMFNAQTFETRSNTNDDIVMNISQSRSESALKSKLTSLTSPVTSATKDLVLSPFSKLAKGVQNFSANLDPRRLSSHVRQIGEKEIEEQRLLQEKWKNSKTRLIAL